MRRFLVLAVVIGVIGTVCYLAACSTQSDGLRVLLITLDTTRADYLGCYGSTEARTPHLDRLAEEGVLFARCSACSPQTLPSHSSIMTGTYPFVHGVRRNGTDRLDPAALTLAEVLGEAGYATQAVVASFVLDSTFGIGQGFDVYRDVVPSDARSDSSQAERKGNAICVDALKALRSLADQRFFLWVHFFDPHYPYESLRAPDAASSEAYADEITFMDRQVGRLLEELSELGIDDETLVVVVGDHGEDLGDHGELEHGFFVYETAMHVPLIFRCPGVLPGGRRVETGVRTVDVAPTILALAGLPPLPDAQGVNLTPLLADGARGVELAAYGEALEGHALLGWSRLRSLTAGGWKYVLAPHPQLFNLETDPGELCNLADERPELAASLREQLRTLIADAPPPIGGGTAKTELSADETARLESLGYVGGVAGDTDQAAAELDRFEPRGDDPTQRVATLGLYARARRSMSSGDFEPAEEQFRQVVESVPDALYPLRDLAFVLQKRRKYEEAAQAYEKALALEPDDRQTLLLLAGLLMETRRFTDAANQFSRILAQHPDDFAAHFMLANALRSLRRLDEAREHYEAAIRIDPQNASVMHGLGLLCREQGDLTEAARCFRKAIELDPDARSSREALRRVEQELKP